MVRTSLRAGASLVGAQEGVAPWDQRRRRPAHDDQADDRSPGLSLQEVEKLQQDPPLFNAVDRFMSREQHRDLRQLLLSLTFDNSPIENSAHSFQRYAFWSLKACHIPVE